VFSILLYVAVALFVGCPLLAFCVPSPEERAARKVAQEREAADRARFLATLATPGPLRGELR